MTHGRSIPLLLVDDAPSGLITAEIVNWTGTCSRGRRASWVDEVTGPCIAKEHDSRRRRCEASVLRDWAITNAVPDVRSLAVLDCKI